EVQIRINPDLVSVNLSGTHTARVWTDNGEPVPSEIRNGKITVKVSAKGITAIAADDLPIVTQFQQRIVEKASPSENSFRIFDSPFGKVKSSIISYGKLSNAYIWLEASNEQASEVTLHY